MINVLIAEKDMNYCRKLINQINIKNPNLRICAIANNIKEIIHAIVNQQIDILIINLELLDCKKIKIENYIDKRKYKKSIILLSNKKIGENDIGFNVYVYDYILKSDDIVDDCKSINNMITTKINFLINDNGIEEDKIKEKIKKELQYLGYNLSYNGTKYLIEAIYLLYTSNNYYDDNLERDIYPIIAKKYGKTINAIKCNIINATNSMYYDCEENKLSNYLYNYQYCKPGPKRVIYAILNKI